MNSPAVYTELVEEITMEWFDRLAMNGKLDFLSTLQKRS